MPRQYTEVRYSYEDDAHNFRLEVIQHDYEEDYITTLIRYKDSGNSPTVLTLTPEILKFLRGIFPKLKDS